MHVLAVPLNKATGHKMRMANHRHASTIRDALTVEANDRSWREPVVRLLLTAGQRVEKIVEFVNNGAGQELLDRDAA